MKIVIPTIGTRGDVQPFIALAQGLIHTGHSITLASHPIMKNLVESHGVNFAPIGPDVDLGKETAAIRRRARNVMAGLAETMRFSFAMLDLSHADILALCRKADLVVVPASSAAGKNEADLLQLPNVSASFMPWGIAYDDPNRALPVRLAYGAIDALVGLITTRPLNRARKSLGLAPVGKEGFTSKLLNLIPVSPVVFSPIPHWEACHRMVGYWFAKPPEAWHPPADLLAFLDKGVAPLLVSLGAMSLYNDQDLESASLFVGAIQQAGVRAIIQGWEESIRQMNLPDTILAAGSLPHSWLLPHCVGAVHHGGFGTTAACLRAGVPALVIPHVADQFYWAQRVFELGTGPQPIRRTKLEATKLASALSDLARNKGLHECATSLAEKIRSETGVENAVSLIEACGCK